MNKIRGLLVVLGFATIILSGGAAYRLWSDNAYDAARYDLWMAGRVSSVTKFLADEFTTAKVATRRAAILGLAGGALGVALVSAGIWSGRQGVAHPEPKKVEA